MMTLYDYILHFKNCWHRAESLKHQIEECDDFYQKALLMDEYNYMLSFVNGNEEHVLSILQKVRATLGIETTFPFESVSDYIIGYGILPISEEDDEAEKLEIQELYHKAISYLKTQEAK
ncbi:MAG: hypothetical protein K6E11_04680 [Bacilli bacterium]|nr:hypothetical protein [Bacilli bacterium]